ncbi:hypothetical protein [Streptomyces canus]|uniref:hypothetical protein n=1 Tax=Streptomyces canus TaxID=58343 RepID=UPI0021F242D1|nr:hypothetical protein [Streptomyces canus]
MGQPGKVDDKGQAVADPIRDDEVATDVLKPSAVTEHVITANGCEVVTELARDHTSQRR